jgi:hypothetical protein
MTGKVTMATLLATVVALVAAMMPVRSAFASAPLTGEVLSGSGTANATTTAICVTLWPTTGGTFSVQGQATGPYPGRFTETGSFSLSQYTRAPAFYKVAFRAQFVITSHKVSITGTMTTPLNFEGGGFGFVCSTSTVTFRLPMNYNAVVRSNTYTGTVEVSPSFKLNAHTASLSESF